MTARTTKTRTLGAALRKAREESGLTLREFAKMIRQDQGVLSRWETGERAARPEHVARILTTLGVTGDRYDDLVAMAQRTDDSYWAATSLPERRRQMMALLESEQKATRLTDVSPLLIPGLLQTSSYAEAMMTRAALPGVEVSTRVLARMSRKEILRRTDPVRLRTAIGSSALNNIIGSTSVMVEQLRYLVDMAKLPNIELRVLPVNSGWTHASEGPFFLLEFPDSPPLVHLETHQSALFLHEQENTRYYANAARTVLESSLDAAESVELIARIAKKLEGSS